MIMTRFGALHSQFTKISVHKGKIPSMQRGDFPCPEGRPYLHAEWQSKGPFLPSTGEEKRKKEIKMRIVAVF